jgi:hypothetical protein
MFVFKFLITTDLFFEKKKKIIQQIIYSLKMKTIVAINNFPDLINAGRLTWSPTVKLRRSIAFFPATSAMGISTATLALPLLPFPLPAKVSIVTWSVQNIQYCDA